MNKMIVANLVHRPIRSLISIIAVAVEVTLILLIVGLALGILDDNKVRQKGTGADIMVRPPGSANFSAFSSAPVSVKVGDIMARPLPALDATTHLDEAYRLLLAGNTGVLVTEGGKVVDIVTRIDLIQYGSQARKSRG